MVAAEVDPGRLVFLRTRWGYIPRLRPFMVTLQGASWSLSKGQARAPEGAAQP
jgi:hypothetical protein